MVCQVVIAPIRYRGYYYDAETGYYYLQSRYYNPDMGRFVNGDGYADTGMDLTSSNMFAYCGNNPVNYSDPSGEKPLWKELGFVYDGSVCDFRRFERGLPPLSYELWLEEGGTKNINSVKYNNHGVKKTLKTATYVPKDKTKDYYINKVRENSSSDIIGKASFLAGAVATFKDVPYLDKILFAVDVIQKFNQKATELELNKFANIMDSGSGVLIITWDIEGTRCGNSSFTEYLSVNKEY